VLVLGSRFSALRMAEGVGFEPTVRQEAHNGFRDRPDKPLRHPSGLSLADGGRGLQALALALGDRALVTGPHLPLRLLSRLAGLLPGLLHLLLEPPHGAA
jgi:hypothetical protein